ncbi:T9SS type A sorting domain-containing protein, partial [Hanstruepera ponticola]|uniref:T9SS type A sorting domain-containing protein n=1 Tax=Hanstruepera ponticola TaxID=2042995 RepID=UPI0017854387
TANYTDACDNQAVEVSVTYTWTEDTEVPVITASTGNIDYTECNPTITPPTFSASDNCLDQDVPVIGQTTGPTNNGCAYSQTWTANYTDACDNQAVEVSVTYTWTVDTEDPVITTNGISGDLGCNPEVVPPSFKVDDNCLDSDMPIQASTNGPTNNGCSYSQTWTANYTDACGNAAEEVSVTYTWTVDTEVPVITTNGVSGDLGCNPEITPPTFKVDDNCLDDEMDLVPSTTGPTNDGCAYSQTWTANYTDACGNAAEEVSVTYTWTVDTELPVIVCPEDLDDICNDEFPSLTATWSDNCSDGGTLTLDGPTRIETAPDGCSEIGYYDFQVYDECGNLGTETCSIIREFDLIDNCETAFAKANSGDQCFIPDFSRWGWTNYFNKYGDYTMDLWAGAAHCDTWRGNLVGTVDVSYSASEVIVTYNIAAGYVMNEAHVYVGCEPYPRGRGRAANYTVAPGQYPFNPSFSGYVQTYSVVVDNETASNSEGIYIIAHAVTCEVICMCSKSMEDVCSEDDNQTEFVGAFECEASTTIGSSIFSSFRAYPVPFDKEVNIAYEMDYDTDVTLEIFDIKGALIQKIKNVNYVKGVEAISTIDMSKTDNQLYFVRITTNKGTVIKKIVSKSPRRR